MSGAAHPWAFTRRAPRGFAILARGPLRRHFFSNQVAVRPHILGLQVFVAALLFSAPLAQARTNAETAPDSTAAPLSVSQLEIDRIEITGVTVFPNAEIEGALEISPGDKPERYKVAKSAENLLNLYRAAGYENAKIHYGIGRKRERRDAEPETVLEFEVAEGAPTRVAAVDFVPENLRPKTNWADIRQALIARFKLEPGAILEEEKVTESKHEIQDALASEEYVGARVTDVRLSDSAAPAGFSPAPAPTARWVKLEVHVDLGDRVTFGFRGNTVFTSVALAGVVEDLRAVGFGKDYVASIKGKIEDEYHSLGYAHAKAEPYVIEEPELQERHVTYVIDEGPRVMIDSIAFDGNIVFDSNELRTRFYAAASDVIKRGYYVDKEVRRAVESVIDWMKSQGYLNAKLVSITPAYPPRPRRMQQGAIARLVVYLYEGDQTVVRQLSLKGATFLDSAKLEALLGMREGQPLNLFALSQGIEAVKNVYRDGGYLDAQVGAPAGQGNQVVTYTPDGQQADVHLEVVEGPRYKVSRIQLEGLQQTRAEVIRRELRFKEGDILSATALRESEANLRKLGIFSNVAVRASDDPDKPGEKIVRISIDEGTPNLIAGGVGFRNDLGVRVFGETAFTNLWGQDHTLSLDVAANHRITEIQSNPPFQFVEYQSQLAYLWPWFGNVPGLNFRPQFAASSTEYINFDATAFSLTAGVDKKLLDAPNLTGLFNYKLEYVDQFQTQDSVDDIRFVVGSLNAELRLDLRDRPLAPTSGFYLSVSDQLAVPGLYSQVYSPEVGALPLGFTKFQERADYLLPIGSQITWFFSARMGWEKSLESPMTTYNTTPGPNFGKADASNGIPLVDQFVLGGEGSLRGFEEQGLNEYGKDIFGTLSYWNFRTQLDLPFAGALRFGPFLDAANLNVDSIWAGPLRLGVGFGFHYQTPVGPVNLDWGFNPYPQQGEESNQIYFSIGLI